MEESKELQGFYKIFRAVIYISVLMEFFEYAIDPRTIDGFGGVVCDQFFQTSAVNFLAVLAYNVGPYKILGNGRFPKSRHQRGYGTQLLQDHTDILAVVGRGNHQ